MRYKQKLVPGRTLYRVHTLDFFWPEDFQVGRFVRIREPNLADRKNLMRDYFDDIRFASDKLSWIEQASRENRWAICAIQDKQEDDT